MAEVDFNSYEAGSVGGRSERFGKALNMAGAACSVALILGLGVWGYKLAVRDVNGVPVMRALAGPMRVAPATPGGDIALHQGLSVNAVAAVGMAASLPDQVLLAPAPVDLTLEDAPGFGDPVLAAVATVAQTEVAQLDLATADMPLDSFVDEVIDPVALSAPLIESGTDAAVALALAEALSDGAVPFEDLAAADPAEDGAAAGIAPQSSPRPQQRPLAGAVPVDVQTVSSAVSPAEIDASTLEVGTRLVQLGAFDDEAGARTEWALLQSRFGDLMGGKAMVVQAAQSGGRTFYRLRAHGFAGEDDARRFCAALVAENTPCIPALHR